MKTLTLSAILALGLLVTPSLAAERSAPAGASVSEKSSQSSEKPKFVGDKRDCLYSAFGSKGKNWHKASESKVNWVLKKCEGCKPAVKTSSLY